jgi:hypothetical protein
MAISTNLTRIRAVAAFQRCVAVQSQLNSELCGFSFAAKEAV